MTDTADRQAADVVRRYWAAAEDRNWTAFGELLAPDVVYELPQSRERIRGRETYVEFNATYPGDWHLMVDQIIAADAKAVSWITFQVDAGEQIGLCFFELGSSGLIERISDFWPEPFDPPPGREHLVERF